MKKTPAVTCLGLAMGLLPAADFPKAEISNGQIRLKLYLPDANNGYYRATRFDWSGVVAGLEYKGHQFYGTWFQRIDPKVHDFTYEGADIVSSPCTAITGPVEEYGGKPLGWDAAAGGGTFIKIGVGVLRKPDGGDYDHFKLYDIVDPGKWTVRKRRDSVEFTQELADPSSGYGYLYRKTVRLARGAPEMVLEHSLTNTGKHPIETSVYNHNFLALDNQPTGPDFAVTLPFPIESRRPFDKDLAAVRGNRIEFLKTFTDRDTVTVGVEGFSDSPKDYDIRVENRKVGAGFRVTADRPLLRAQLWSIRTVLCVEPFIDLKIEPGAEFHWKLTYTYYTLP